MRTTFKVEFSGEQGYIYHDSFTKALMCFVTHPKALCLKILFNDQEMSAVELNANGTYRAISSMTVSGTQAMMDKVNPCTTPEK